MEQTDHIMLVGEGASRFAGWARVSRQRIFRPKNRVWPWMVWKQSLRDAAGHNNWAPGLSAPPAKLKSQFPAVSTKPTLAWAWEVATHYLHRANPFNLPGAEPSKGE